jgi:hypothetical protein
VRVGVQARERLRQLGSPPRPIPTKALIPILEKASLEGPDSLLIEMWGNLLASASAEYDVEVITFAEILAAIGPRERKIIEQMLGIGGLGPWKDRRARSVLGAGFELYEQQQRIKPELLRAIDSEDQGIFEWLRQFMPEGYPVLFSKAVRGVATQRANRPSRVFENTFYAQNSPGFEILKKQGLIEEAGAGFSWPSDGSQPPLSVGWFAFTELGYAFVMRVVEAASSSAGPPESTGSQTT